MYNPEIKENPSLSNTTLEGSHFISPSPILILSWERHRCTWQLSTATTPLLRCCSVRASAGTPAPRWTGPLSIWQQPRDTPV